MAFDEASSVFRAGRADFRDASAADFRDACVDFRDAWVDIREGGWISAKGHRISADSDHGFATTRWIFAARQDFCGG